MSMDVYDWQRLYRETVEKFKAAFDELKETMDQVELACMVSSEDHLQELGSVLFDARERAEAEIDSIVRLGEVMILL